MPRNCVFVVNPASGRGAAKAKWARISRRLDNARVLTTRQRGDGTALAREAVRLGAEVVVACGGDGTVSEVAAGIADSEAVLAVIPLGTGNDFSRRLGHGTNADAALATLDHGKISPLGAIRWTCGGREGLAVNICGCGFDAVVAERINRSGRMLKGTTAYIVAVLDTLRTFRSVNLRLTIDGETLDTDAMLCAVANAVSYGGGMKVAPNARIDDGWLDMVVVKGVSKFEFLRAFPRVFSGSHLDHPRVISRQARRVRIEAAESVPCLSDGELVGRTPIEFEIVPGLLQVLRPSYLPERRSEAKKMSAPDREDTG